MLIWWTVAVTTATPTILSFITNLLSEPLFTNLKQNTGRSCRVIMLLKLQTQELLACFPRASSTFAKWPGAELSAWAHTWQITASYPWELKCMLSSHFLWLQNRQGPAAWCWHSSHYWREHYLSVLHLLIIYQWRDSSPEKSKAFVFHWKVHSFNRGWPRKGKLINHSPCVSLICKLLF